MNGKKIRKDKIKVLCVKGRRLLRSDGESLGAKEGFLGRAESRIALVAMEFDCLPLASGVKGFAPLLLVELSLNLLDLSEEIS